jgi:hypothetical protein
VSWFVERTGQRSRWRRYPKRYEIIKGELNLHRNVFSTGNLRGSGLRCVLQPFESLLQSPTWVPLFFSKSSLGHGITAAWNVVTVYVQGDQRLDVELLLSNSVLVRVLMEPHGDQLNYDLLAASDEGNDEESKDETLEDVEVGVGRGGGVTDEGVFAGEVDD